MDLPLTRDDVYTVKVYFIKPIDLISVVINTLIEMEYETYTLGEYDADQLPKVLSLEKRNVLFICVTSRQEAAKWLDFAKQTRESTPTQLQIGVFAYNTMEAGLKRQFLLNQISVTSFNQLGKNALGVVRAILQVFEARGRRQYIRVRARGHSQALISVKDKDQPIKGVIKDLSTAAFVCDVPEIYHHHFEIGQYLDEVLLVLKGIRIRTAAKVLGYSRDKKNHFILKYCSLNMQDGRIQYDEQLPRERKHKLCSYIRTCLREELNELLAAPSG